MNSPVPVNSPLPEKSPLPQNFAEVLESVQKTGDGLPTPLVLERKFSLEAVLSWRNFVGLDESHEPLVAIPEAPFARPHRHRYQSLGAPYGHHSPFHLREQVLGMLVSAADLLTQLRPGYKLHIFDAFRPLTAQRYMFKRAVMLAGRKLQLPARMTSEERELALVEAQKLWAFPNRNPLRPPPHSTGAALDVTIVDPQGRRLPMGSRFDERSERILPNYYAAARTRDGIEYHCNRVLLRMVMEGAGFRRLPGEWWHFSYGDQVWALLQGLESGELPKAIYGRAD